MHRRIFLSLCAGGVAGLAGCADGESTTDAGAGRVTDSPTRTATPTVTPNTTPSPTPDDVAALAVAPERLQPALVTLDTPDSIGVTSAAATQYLYLRADVTAREAPSRDELAVRFDGDAYGPRPAQETFGLWRAYNHGQERYTAARGAGWLLFALPATGDAGDAALTWPGGEWPFPPELRERLAAPLPELALDWTVPETVESGAEPSVEFAVTNEGGVAGCFVGALNRTGGGIAYAPIAGLRRLVPAGETVSWSVTDSLDVEVLDEGALGDGEPDMEYKLQWTGERRTAGVRVVDGR